MDIQKAEEIREMLRELDNLSDIDRALDRGKTHWWGVLTPDLKRSTENGLEMPEILRRKFSQAVKESIKEIKEKINKQ